MTRRSDRRADCRIIRRPDATPAALRAEVRALRQRVEGLWSAALLGEDLAVEDVHAIALALSGLRLRIGIVVADDEARPEDDVVAARDDVAGCVVAVSDLVAHFAAA